jgi:glycerol-3-phosphate dehydrogenase
MPEQQTIDDLRPHYRVLIIGAGINGCGTFRDLTLQGIDCLLIDRGDVCEGASAASSRLIHGGIKYLETGEFRLVRESAMERNRLIRNAPHYVKPLETVLPMQSWFGGVIPSAKRFLGLKAKLRDRGAAITEVGLRIYDAYNRKVRALPGHSFYSQKKLRAEYPGLDSKIIAAGLYYEGHITHAERLGFELVSDGLAANSGSALSTYTTATTSSAAGELCLTDQLTGNVRTLTADVIINAGGAWIDKVNAGLGISSRHIGGSKGSHLIIDSPQLLAALKGRMIYFGTADGRVNLIYPFFGHVLAGSTDIAVKDPDEAICDDDETDYLLRTVAEILPAISLTREQILLTYSGVRPLPRSEGVDIGTVSRDHAIARDQLPGTERPVLSLIGGKWTTFRAFSAQATDDVLSILGKPRVISTEDIAIGGGRAFPIDAGAHAQWVSNLAEAYGLPTTRAHALLTRYGTTAEKVAHAIAAAPDSPLASLPGYSHTEITWLCRTEQTRRLSDLLFRRTAIAMEGLLTPAAIFESAHIAAAALGWNANRTSQEIALTTSELTRRLPRAKLAA